MRSMFSVMPAAQGSLSPPGTVGLEILGQRFDRGRRGNARLLDVGAEHGEILQGRHGDNVPVPHGVETHPVLELGRVVDLDATL